MHQLSSLLYISLAPSSADEQTVQYILTTSHRRNAALGISGALLHHAGYYLQVLEGESKAVQALYQRMRLDTRHFDARLRALEAVTQRQFGGWAMHRIPAPPSTECSVGDFLRSLWRGNRGVEAHTALALLRRLADAAAPLSASSPSAVPAHRSANAPRRRSVASPNCVVADTAE
jgi:Sensors of blue-light using FAD